MTTTPPDRTGYRLAIVDQDPLRARKEARELLAELADVDPSAALDVAQLPAPGSADKGLLSADAIGLLISAGSLVATVVQMWLARVPQRTVIVQRPDGTTLHLTGKQAREDDALIDRFLAVSTEQTLGADSIGSGSLGDGDARGPSTGPDA